MNKDNIKAIEDFLIVKNDKIKRASIALIFGGKDLKFSDRAAKLFKKNYCDYILISGGRNKKLNGITEADWHKDNLVKQGIPKNKVLLEPKATNSLENVLFSKKVILKRFGKLPKKLIVIGKSFHGRRILMTLRKNFSKDTEYIFQLVQTKKHEIKNWWKRKEVKNHIIDEIRKIGEYTLKGDIDYN